MNPNATAPSPISSSPAATPAAGHPRRPAQPSQHPFAVQLHCPCLHVTADEFLDQQRDAISARQHIGDQRRRRIRPQRRAHQLAHCPLRQRPDRQYRRQTLPPQRPDNSVSIRRLPGAQRAQDNEATDLRADHVPDRVDALRVGDVQVIGDQHGCAGTLDDAAQDTDNRLQRQKTKLPGVHVAPAFRRGQLREDKAQAADERLLRIGSRVGTQPRPEGVRDHGERYRCRQPRPASEQRDAIMPGRDGRGSK